MVRSDRMLKVCAGLAAFLTALPVAAQACVALAGAPKVESDRYVLAYRTQPDKLAVGQHFSMDLAVCPKGGQPAPETVRVDAHMPEHRHGMNYKTTVKPGDGGRYFAEGFMFHMPGRWEFIFEVRSGGKTDRVTRSVTLE
jgi:YtkA-like protein